MKTLLKNIVTCIGGGFVLSILQIIFQPKSKYITTFLKENLIIIIITLLAINMVNIGIILTKLVEISNKSINETKPSFEKTRKSLYFSIIEQIALIFIAFIIFLLPESNIFILSDVYKCYQPIIDMTIDTIIIACFIYDILILYDISKDIFIIIDHIINNKLD